MKMYCADVSFVSNMDVNVDHKIVKGKRDSIFVKSRQKSDRALKEAAKEKLMACYGVTPTDMKVYNRFEYND